jgi:photosystem II stability/assembly factor-like uncharacterized protein
VRYLYFFFLLFSGTVSAQQWKTLMIDPSVNFFDVERSFTQWKDSVDNLDYGTFYRVIHQRDIAESEEQFAEAEEEYFHWTAEMRFYIDENGNRLSPQFQAQRYSSAFARSGNSSFLQIQGSWVERGPTNITTAYSSVLGVGRTTCIALDANDSNLVYLVAAGVLWRSPDNANTWTLLIDSAAAFPISFVKTDPVHSDTLYVMSGGQLYKSIDAAATWTLLNIGISTISANFKFLIDPANTENLLLGSFGNGIRKSTDGGATWTVINTNYYTDLELRPGNSSVVYGLSGNYFYRSMDGGQTFTVTDTINGTYSMFEIGVTIADTAYVYTYGSISNGAGGQVALSTDGGTSFTVMPVSNNIFSTSGLSHFQVSPIDKNLLIQGGIDCSRSTNGGLTWAYAASWNNPNSTGLSYQHVDNRFITFSGASYWSCNDGGVSKSENGGATWVDKSNGLGIANIYRLACAESDTAVFICGTLDDATLRHDASGWVNVFGGDNYDVAINPSNPLNIYSKNQYNFQRSNNCGVTLTGNPFTGLTESVYGYNPGFPIAFSAQNPQSVFLCVSNVWKSTNGGNNVTQISNFTAPYTGGGFLYVCETDSNVIFTAHYHTTNGGATWTLNNKMVLAVDPNEPNKVWAKNYYYEAFGIFYSSDTGNTWTEIPSGDIPSSNTIGMRCVNNADNGVFLFSGANIFYLDDRLSNWQPFNNGLPYVSVSDMVVLENYGKVRISTMGRGVWESDLYDSTQALQAGFYSDKDSVCPGDFVQFFDNSLNNGPGFGATYQWYFPGGSPSVSTAASPVVSYGATGTYDATLVVTNSNGVDSLTQTMFIVVNTPSAGTIPLAEGFETAFYPAGWNVNHYNSWPHWMWAPVYLNNYGAYEQSAHSVRYYSWTNYAPDSDYFTTPALDLSQTFDPILVYDICYPFDNADADSMKIFYTTDCGATRNYLFSYGGTNMQTATTTGNFYFLPDSNGWRTDTLHLTAIANMTDVQIGFEIFSITRCEVYLDNINIVTGPGIPTALPGNGISFLDVYPNPAEDMLNLNFTPLRDPGGRIFIYDATGRTVMEMELPPGASTIRLDISELPAGFYWCAMYCGEEMRSGSSFAVVKW